MKRIVVLCLLLFFVSFYILPNLYERIIVYEETLVLKPSLRSFFPKRSQEGFDAETLVPTPFGYKKIQNIKEGDSIIDFKGERKKVIAKTGIFLDKFVKLLIDDTYIYTGCDQVYYTYPHCQKIDAQNIKEGDLLYNGANEYSLVKDMKLINEYALFYYLTVENHVFCISPKSLYVHNAELLINGLASMSLGCIVITNPIAATIGAGIALSFIVDRSYEAYLQKNQCSENINLLKKVVLAERSYYFKRLDELQTLKKELIDIKNGLEAIQVLCNGCFIFTYQFLNQINIQNIYSQNELLTISSEKEIALSDNQKDNLRPSIIFTRSFCGILLSFFLKNQSLSPVGQLFAPRLQYTLCCSLLLCLF